MCTPKLVYSTIMALGACSAVLLCQGLARRARLRSGRVRAVALVLILTGVGGAHLVGAVRFVPCTRDLLPPGHSMVGGLLLAGAVLCAFARAYTAEARPTCDVLFTALPLGLAIGRLACLYAGCCYGNLFGVPVQIVAAGADGTALLWLLRRFSHRGADGRSPFLFLVFYGTKRFVLGFFREDAPRVLAGMSVFQIVGLLFACGGVAGLVLRVGGNDAARLAGGPISGTLPPLRESEAQCPGDPPPSGEAASRGPVQPSPLRETDE